MSERADMQACILDYIRDEIEARGCAPSIKEIGRAVGLSSTCTVFRYLEQLEIKGLIERVPRKPRAIRLVEGGRNEKA